MKRYLPFLIVAAAAIFTVGIMVIAVRANRRAPANVRPNEMLAGGGELVPTHAMGPVDAPVTLEEYGDFQCPACAATSVNLHTLVQEFPTRLRLVFWQFPLAMHEHAREAALAAEASSRQGHFWEMHDLLYRNQGGWKNVPVVGLEFEKFAQELHLDAEKFHHDLVNAEVAARVDAERAQGEARGVKNTPTLFINGQEFPPPFSPERLRQGVEDALKSKEKP